MKLKNEHRVRKWGDYKKGLISRGSIHLWISPKTVKNWEYKGKQKPGGIKKFSDIAIQACLLIREVYQLSVRQCEGFVRSLGSFFGIKEVPSYTTLCRRMSEIKFDLISQLPTKKNLHVLIDSTGLKVCGESEWYKKKHNLRTYSLWSTLHLAMDHESQKVLSVKRSDAHGYDSKYLGPLLDIPELDIRCIYADGAYDKRLCYQKAHKREAGLIVPVQKSACKQKANRNHPYDESLLDRDRKIDFIREFEDEDIGRKAWKICSGYHKRSLVETTMYRLKQYFGDRLQCESKEHQQKQMEARVFALNTMTDTGMPISVVR